MTHPHPRVFWQKRLQATENKGSVPAKESKERKRGGKLKKIKGKWRVAGKSATQRALRSEHRGRRGVTPRGFCMDVKIRELREKGFVRI